MGLLGRKGSSTSEKVKRRISKALNRVSLDSTREAPENKSGLASAPTKVKSTGNRVAKTANSVKNIVKGTVSKAAKEAIDSFTGMVAWVFKISFGILLLIAIGDLVGGQESHSAFETKVLLSQEDTEDVIAVVRMEGIIWKRAREVEATISAEDYLELINHLRRDENVKGVLLVIDSPGGEVYASDILYRSIKSLSDKKPVYVYAESTLASGAYYIAMGARKVYVNGLTEVGSIGVIVELINYDGLLEKLGIKVRRMTNTGGRFKSGEGLFDDNPNGEEDRLMQRLIDVAYERFLSIVANSRKLPIERVKSIADGRVMPAVDAKEYGLVDKITTISGALNDLKDIIGIKKAKVVEYRLKRTTVPFLSALEGVFSAVKRGTEMPRFRLLYMQKY